MKRVDWRLAAGLLGTGVLILASAAPPSKGTDSGAGETSTVAVIQNNYSDSIFSLSVRITPPGGTVPAVVDGGESDGGTAAQGSGTTTTVLFSNLRVSGSSASSASQPITAPTGSTSVWVLQATSLGQTSNLTSDPITLTNSSGTVTLTYDFDAATGNFGASAHYGGPQ